MSFFDSLFSSPDVPTAPNYAPLLGIAQQTQGVDAGNSAEQQAWAKQQDAKNQATNSGVVNADTGLQGSQNNFGAGLQDEYNTLVKPEYKSLVDEAQSYASPSRRDANIGAAKAGVAQDFEAQRQNAQRNLESYGISPESTRFAALDIGTRTQQAAAQAAAGTQAGLQTDATGRALRSEALNTGALLPGQAAGTFNTGLQAGSGAVNADLATTASGANTMGTGTQWSSLGNNALGTYGNTLNQDYNNKMGEYKAKSTQSSGLGSVLGAAASIAPMFLSGGGAVPDGTEVDDNGQKGPYNPAHFYAIPLNGGPGGRMTPREAVDHFHTTKRHAGVFNSHHEAFDAFGHGSDDPQRQNYGAYADGGATNDQTAGGQSGAPSGAVPVSASPSRGGAIDDVPARLTPGEFVIPKDTLTWNGEKFFQRLIEKSRQEKAEAGAKPKMGSAPPQKPTFVSQPAVG